MYVSRSPAVARLFSSLVFFTALTTLLTAGVAGAKAQDASPAKSSGQLCPRFAAGSQLVEPKGLFSSHGVLRVNLTYKTRVGGDGLPLFCFTDEDGNQSPTLHVKPGDQLVISLRNDVAPTPMKAMRGMAMTMGSGAVTGPKVAGEASADCGVMVMTGASTNMHFHGTNTPPICHQDEVIKTLINSGESFEYDLHFPLNEPSGLYWYHPHVHGSSEVAVQGGASGAIIVDGIQNVVKEVAGLPIHLLIFRDNQVPSDVDPSSGESKSSTDAKETPAWDISLNYTPIAYPKYTPVVMPVKPSEKQFWRVLNASADTILDLQLRYDGVAQPLRIVALDAVALGSQEDLVSGHPIDRNHVRLPPAGRAEFVIETPSAKVKLAELVTMNIDTGPDGDNDPLRPVLKLIAATKQLLPERMPPVNGSPAAVARFSGLREAVPSVKRKLYFSEVLSDPNNPDSPTNFYITVDGAKPVLFSPDNPPAIVTKAGTVEDWEIENRALENHEFHIHQIHFLVLDSNKLPSDGQYLDTIEVPYWSGTGPYPNVKLRMDFRGPVVGDFVYHCHILGHEDSGMMAVIRVLPK